MPARDLSPTETAEPSTPAQHAPGAALGSVSGAGEPGTEAHNERWQTVVENTSDLISEADERGVLLFVSPNHEAVLGYKPSEMIGRLAHDFMHPEDLERVQEVMSRVREPGDQAAFEMRVRHLDGSWLWSGSTVRLGRNAEGERFWLCVSHDISERKRLEEERVLLSLLLEIVNRDDDLQAVTRSLSRALKPLLPFDLLFISLIGPSGMHLAASDLPLGDDTPIFFDPRSDGTFYIWPRILASGGTQVLFENDFPLCTSEMWARQLGCSVEEFERWPRSNANMRAYINAPLRVDGVPVGVLHFDSFQPHIFTPEHLRLAGIVADHIAGALRRLQSLDAAREARERLVEIVAQVDAIVWEGDPQAGTLDLCVASRPRMAGLRARGVDRPHPREDGALAAPRRTRAHPPALLQPHGSGPRSHLRVPPAQTPRAADARAPST